MYIQGCWGYRYMKYELKKYDSIKFDLMLRVFIKLLLVLLTWKSSDFHVTVFQRNSKLQSLDLEGCEIRPLGAKYMFDVLEKRTNITEIVSYKNN